MYQLNPALLDSETNQESKTIYKKNQNNLSNQLNKTYKNKKTVNFNTNEVTENNPKNKLNNINKVLAKLHTLNDEDNDTDNDSINYKDLHTGENSYSNINESNISDMNIDQKRFFDQNSVKGQHDKQNQQDQSDENNISNYNNPNVVYSNLNDSYNPNLSYLNNENKQQNFYNEQSNGTLFDNKQLLTKLDYIIHLLEEQHNEKTNHITEELILYLFLGIFIIFVLDSFARASKYTR